MIASDKIPFRTIRVRGIVDPGSIIEVYINGVLNKHDSATNESLFEFQTLVSFHGALPIRITVIKGKITLGDTVVTYPAVINDVNGYFSFRIPLEDLIAEVSDNKVKQYKNYSITLVEGETFVCQHLLVNGPSQWVIRIKDTAHNNMIVYTEDIDDPIPLISYISPEFYYRPYDPNHCKSQSLVKLIKQLTDPTYINERIDFSMPSWV